MPPPYGTGGGASYDDAHLLPLQVIKVLHENQIKLAGIKEALAGMSLEQMRALMAEAETGKRSWDSESLRKWVRPETAHETTTFPRNFSFAAIGSQQAGEAASASSSNLLGRLTRQYTHLQETWVRICPVEGVEIQMREDIDPKTKALVMQLIQQLQNPQ